MPRHYHYRHHYQGGIFKKGNRYRFPKGHTPWNKGRRYHLVQGFPSGVRPSGSIRYHHHEMH